MQYMENNKQTTNKPNGGIKQAFKGLNPEDQ